MSTDGFKDRLGYLVGGGRNVSAFAKKCGFAESVLRSYLSGNSLPGLDKLVSIAETTNVSLGWLATGEGIVPEGKTVKITGKITDVLPPFEVVTLSYEIDDLFATRLSGELEDKKIEWLSAKSRVDVQRIASFLANEALPTVDELSSIADALGVSARWLAERSTIQSENWKFEFYKKDEKSVLPAGIFKLYLMAVEDYIGRIDSSEKLTLDLKADVINTICRVHMKETPNSKEKNRELIKHICELAIDKITFGHYRPSFKL